MRTNLLLLGKIFVRKYVLKQIVFESKHCSIGCKSPSLSYTSVRTEIVNAQSFEANKKCMERKFTQKFDWKWVTLAARSNAAPRQLQ